jgi:uncharacterized membrane protein
MRGKNSDIDRQQWKDNTTLLFIMAAIWLITGFTLNPEKPSIPILIFIIGFTLINPLFFYIKALCNRKQPHKESNTQQIISFLTLGMTIGLIPVFFAFIKNPDMFFPAFGLVQGFILLLAGKQIKSASIRLTGFLILINAIRYYESFSINHLGFEFGTSIIYFAVGIYSAINHWVANQIIVKDSKPKALPNSQ